MTPDQLFSIANAMALLAWILLIVLPRQRRISDLLAPVAMPALFAAMYVSILVTQRRGSPGGFSSLPAVAVLISQPWLLLPAGCTTALI
jgi:hypothetical protein